MEDLSPSPSVLIVGVVGTALIDITRSVYYGLVNKCSEVFPLIKPSFRKKEKESGILSDTIVDSRLDV